MRKTRLFFFLFLLFINISSAGAEYIALTPGEKESAESSKDEKSKKALSN